MSQATAYPEFIKNLPRAALAADDINAYLLSSPQGQVVFFDLPAGATVPLHSHGEQWGIVVSGEVEITVGEATRIYRAGECYHIPAGVPHGGTILAPSQVIDVFAEPNRYSSRG